jgi:hypothetical protein
MEGSEGAFRELNAALEDNLKDLKSRWLLNIAAMTMARYTRPSRRNFWFRWIASSPITTPGSFPTWRPTPELLRWGTLEASRWKISTAMAFWI